MLIVGRTILWIGNGSTAAAFQAMAANVSNHSGSAGSGGSGGSQSAAGGGGKARSSLSLQYLSGRYVKLLLLLLLQIGRQAGRKACR